MDEDLIQGRGVLLGDQLIKGAELVVIVLRNFDNFQAGLAWTPLLTK